MDTNRAKQLIETTFENPFNERNFNDFIINLIKNNYTSENRRVQSGNFIPEAYRNFVSSYKRILKYKANNKRIDVLIVNLARGSSIERARTKQRNFIRDYLLGKHYSNSLKDAALVAFVSPESEDWRFSLVKLDYRLSNTEKGKTKIEEELTPARRWSFLVGKNEKSHTAQGKLLPLLEDDELTITLEHLEEAFNIEVVTKEFFEKYRELFIRTKLELDELVRRNARIQKELEGKKINTVDFAKKLLGQVTFLYFLQKKGWFGVERGKAWGTGAKNFMRRLFNKEFGNYENFYNDILEPLFYEALRTDRSSADHYYSRFNCKIPFLNGGLFDPISTFDWVNVDIHLPNKLFSNQNKTKEGDVGDGILDVFDRYNFTVNEEEPLEKEVALDPELLGKIYEKLNAIRQDNFDEYVKILKSGKKGDETKFNKEYGVYYTPREIVHYMCRESLINYLVCNTSIPVSDIEKFIEIADSVQEIESIALEKEEKIKSGEQKSTKYESQIPENIRQNAGEIDRLLADVKVCDPAVGSGAFPVGMMHEIVKLRQLLSIYSPANTSTGDVTQAFLPVDNKSQTGMSVLHSTYDLKRHCIENSLYGVDIDSGAVEICKLRFWLSMIVDEDDFYNIKPLPNLEYKVVCGDSLLGFPENWGSALEKEIEALEDQYFNETNPSKKQELKNIIDEKIKYRLEQSEKIFGYKINFDFRLFFPKVFREKRGVDVVIANPPYVQLQKNGGKLANLYSKLNFETFNRMGDIYCLFYEKGIKILKDEGHLCYITSNKWMRAGYGEKLREFFIKQNPILLIDLGPGIFESATVDTSIILIRKQKTTDFNLKAITLQKTDEQSIEEQVKQNSVILTQLTKDAWFIGSYAERQLKEKIERIGKPLKEWDVKIYRGVLTGLNEAFIISTEKRNEILANCKDEEERKRTEAIIKPILRGRDIKRYYYEWAGLWVIIIPAGWTNENKGRKNAETFINETYPLIMKHLKLFEVKAKKRDDQGDYWWELRHCAYYPEFEKEKVVYSEIVRQPQFYFDTGKFYVEASSFLMTGKGVKYICGLLNSKPITYFFKEWYAGGGLGEEGYRYKKAFLENLPLPPITPENQPIVRQIESLVDKILTSKKENPQADTSHWEKEIDRLVYKLYDLTEDEIKIIERN